MKKVIVAILCTTFFVTFSSTFANANSKTIEKYIYAQDWTYNIKWQESTEKYESNFYTSTELENMLQTCKNNYILSDIKSHYSYLSWDKFENVKIYETDLGNSEVIAKYLKSSNTIIVNMSIFTSIDYNSKNLCLMHELAHCITSSDESISSGGFNEPIAELITYSVCEAQHIDFDFCYRDASMIYMMICNSYGLDKSIHDFYYGTFITNLNSITDNYGTDLASILYYITHTEEIEKIQFNYNDLLMMAQDIAIHANLNTNSSLEDCTKFLIINTDYFKNLIS